MLIDYDLYQEELKAQFDKGCIKALDGFRVELWEVYRDKEVVCDPHQAAFRLKELFGNRTDLLKDVARLMGIDLDATLSEEDFERLIEIAKKEEDEIK